MSEKPHKSSSKGKRTRVCDIYNNAEDQYMCLERAGMLLERLDTGPPKFAKCMLPSNVLYSFWLILPKKFCALHFPEHDTTITLVDESGMEFKTNYLSARHGLSGGWRGFSFSQKLQQGDILFFRLVGSGRLQVHIVRRYGLEAVEAAFSLLEMHPRVKRTKTLTSGNVKYEKVNKGKRMKRRPRKLFVMPPNNHPTPVDIEEDAQWTSYTSLYDQCANSLIVMTCLTLLKGLSNELQPEERGFCSPHLLPKGNQQRVNFPKET